jgi:hypothetical protein
MITIINGEPTEDQLHELTVAANEYYNNVYQIAMSELENDMQKQVFMDWWNGKSLWKWNEEKRDHDIAEAYKDIDNKDWNKANDYILWACGQGCG